MPGRTGLRGLLLGGQRFHEHAHERRRPTTYPISNTAVRSRITALKASGACVRVSFGGATGTELALTCTSASALAEAYGKALDAAGSTEADFDVEGDALTDTDTASVDRRSQAIALLRKQRPVLNSANQYAVTVSTVTVTAMDYGTDTSTAQAECSGVDQEDGAFLKALAG